MSEKIMLLDLMNCIKYELIMYENIIEQTENLGLRQVLVQIRNNTESTEYEIYKIAKMKGYYKPIETATSIEIQNVKNDLQKKSDEQKNI